MMKKGGYKGRIFIMGGFGSKRGGFKGADLIRGGFYERADFFFEEGRI